MDSRLARLALTQSSSSTSGSNGRNRRRIYEAEVLPDDEEGPSAIETASQQLSHGDVLEGDHPLLYTLTEAQDREENEEDIAARRQRVRARLAMKRTEIDQPPTAASSSAASASAPSSSSSRGIISQAEKLSQSNAQNDQNSEYETDSDEEEEETDSEDDKKLLKPLFISRQYRETLRQQEEEEKLQEIKQQQLLLLREERKHQTRVLLAESIKKQNDLDAMRDITDNDSDAGMPDDVDYDDDRGGGGTRDGEEDEEDERGDEYRAWKIREMYRIKRETEQREEMIREAKDIERRRGMTDEERYQEDLRAGRFEEKEKKKWKFLQKYYHKGVFYMDDNSVQKKTIQSQYSSSSTSSSSVMGVDGEVKPDARLRDYDEPTLEDKFNKESLPTILQVKKFGLRGRTKYTHLVDQDTTDFMQPLKQDERVKANYMAKRAGMGEISTRRKRSKLE
jgi:microfibrillar-associated protein 1